MRPNSLLCAVLVVAWVAAPCAHAQTAPRGQAASPGQSRADNRLPQPPSGGVATGKPAAGPMTDTQRQADDEAKKSTTICKGC